jgi:hypothetical protein
MESKVFSVTGVLDGKKSGKQTRQVEAGSKAAIWNRPKSFGFAKVFSVEEKKD